MDPLRVLLEGLVIRVPVKRDDALSARSARLVEVMRRITEEIREEIVQTIRGPKNGST